MKFKINLMEIYFVLKRLQIRNNILKSRLIHEQLKNGTYHFGYFKKFLLVINEYKKFHSFFKVSEVVGISQLELLRWYVQGQLGNPKFRAFYLTINAINNIETQNKREETSQEDPSSDDK